MCLSPGPGKLVQVKSIKKKSTMKNSYNSRATVNFHLSVFSGYYYVCHISLQRRENLLSATVNTSTLGLSEEYHSYSK
jgi:hypothetical protein